MEIASERDVALGRRTESQVLQRLAIGLALELARVVGDGFAKPLLLVVEIHPVLLHLPERVGDIRVAFVDLGKNVVDIDQYFACHRSPFRRCCRRLAMERLRRLRLLRSARSRRRLSWCRCSIWDRRWWR